MFLPVFVCLCVCLLARLLKNAYMDLDEMLRVDIDVGTWTNWLTFEPDPDHSPDAGTGLLSPISCKLRNLQLRGILRRENSAAASERASEPCIHCAVGTPLSEVNALYRVPF